MKKSSIIGYAICVIFLLWMFTSTIEVWLHNSKGNEYSKSNIWVLISSHTTDMKVVDCTREKGNEYYTVTVEDIKGNQYDYYDDVQRETGTVLRVTQSGTSIINAK